MQINVLDLMNHFEPPAAIEGSSANPKRIGKFMLITGPEELTLIFGEVKEYAYHANLVYRYCQLREIPCGWEKKPDLLEIYDPQIRLHGGGWFELDETAGHIRFFGSSTAYGRFHPTRMNTVISDHAYFSKLNVEVSS